MKLANLIRTMQTGVKNMFFCSTVMFSHLLLLIMLNYGQHENMQCTVQT